MEMYLAGVSLRRVEAITEALWGTRVSPGTLSTLNQKLYSQIETWRNRPIEGEHPYLYLDGPLSGRPYLYLDGIVLKRSRAGEVRNVSLLLAVAVKADGYRESLGSLEEARATSRPAGSTTAATAAIPCKRASGPPSRQVRFSPASMPSSSSSFRSRSASLGALNPEFQSAQKLRQGAGPGGRGFIVRPGLTILRRSASKDLAEGTGEVRQGVEA